MAAPPHGPHGGAPDRPLELTSGAYLQWIGYSCALVVECSSNAFLPLAGRLSAQEEAALIRARFSGPDEDTLNF